jgi:hypothetical protein
MRYESKRTKNGNVGVSTVSQEAADAQARQMDANGCVNCYNCSRCSGCSDCSGTLRWYGPKAENLTSLNGLRWPISVSKTHMQIGCQNHSHADWESFSDAQISSKADTAWEFWQEWKPTLMAMCKWKASQS